MTRLVLIFIFLVLHPHVIHALACSPGAYFDGIKCSLCPGGSFGERPGLTQPECSGKCAGGYFCPPGSTSAWQNACGRSVYFCPPGSASRSPVGDQYYTVAAAQDANRQVLGVSARNAAAEQKMCEPGYFCRLGIRYPCPAGSYGVSYGLTTSQCTGACSKGFYCPLATAHPPPCPPGTYGGQLGLVDASCSGPCPRGYYCESGTVVPKPCPAGTLGSSLKLTTVDCSSQCTRVGAATVCSPSPCPAGFFCPLMSADPVPCGGVNLFCPLGSSTPTTVSNGFYTTWTPSVGVNLQGTGALEDAYLDGNALAAANQTTRSAQKLCEKGAFCTEGVKKLCPAGVYGDREGLQTAACSAPCPAGYFCPVGTANFPKLPCTLRAAFCRLSSAAPTPVTAGYFTVLSTENLRIDQTICPLGNYCVGGVPYRCPIGTYGGTTGLSKPTCSGRCQDGHICPPGSTSPTQSPCPAGSYSQNGINCSPCAPGYWCTAGSPSRYQNACGSDSRYCPLGSASSVSVSDGRYAMGQQLTTHTLQAVCVVRNAQHVPQCPTRTVGVNSGL